MLRSPTCLRRPRRADHGFVATICNGSACCSTGSWRWPTMLNKLRRICKVQFAAAWNACLARPRQKWRILLYAHQHESINSLDISSLAAYFILHLYLARRRLAETRSQARSRARTRPTVRRGRFLRCPRSGPDQVRDAAPCAGRARLQSRGRRALRYVAPDALPGRSGGRARGPGGPVAQAARPQGGAQAQRASHGLCREAPVKRRSDACAGPGAGDRISARVISSSAQHRTRARAQKKNVAETAPERLPQAAAATYETLRAEVLSGRGRPEGLAALRFHGMVQGLVLLLTAPAQPVAPTPKLETIKPIQR